MDNVADKPLAGDQIESFRFEEYKILRARAHDMVRRIDELERNVVVACSAIFVFALSGLESDEFVPRFILFALPWFVSLIGYYKYTGLSSYLKSLNEYTAELEHKLNGGPGWLHCYYKNQKNDRGNSYFRSYRINLWYFILVFNFLVGFVLVVAGWGK